MDTLMIYSPYPPPNTSLILLSLLEHPLPEDAHRHKSPVTVH